MRRGDFIEVVVTLRANAKCNDPRAGHPVTRVKHQLEGHVHGFDLWSVSTEGVKPPVKKKRGAK